jgi:hypothetical protein
MPFNPGKVEEPPSKDNSTPNKDLIHIEKSVLNSRYIVEQEIDPTQKLHIRKDKIEFLSAKDVLENRSNKKKILEQRALKKVWRAIPRGFQSFIKTL